MKMPLRTGYTTGACAAAASKGATLMLAGQRLVSEVTIALTGGINATFRLYGQSYSGDGASCFVIKDAGDDPDVTNGVEVWAKISVPPPSTILHRKGGEYVIIITGGIGIGKVTKPGLAIPPGEPAINPVPRQMIEEAVRSVFSPCPLSPVPSTLSPVPSTLSPVPCTLQIMISIPDGEERAKKTLNSRLGILGGLSILGTTGIVRPISAKAWTDTIDAALDVAKACNCETVVLSTGRSSEMAAQEFLRAGDRGQGTGDSRQQNLKSSSCNLLHPAPCPLSPLPYNTLPEEAYIMMGDHIAYAVRACAKRGFKQPIIACQFAKLLKIACGHENTHAAVSEVDLAILRRWAEEACLSPSIIAIIAQANTAREIVVASNFDEALTEIVASHAVDASAKHAPGIKAHPLLCRYDGKVMRSSK